MEGTDKAMRQMREMIAGVLIVGLSLFISNLVYAQDSTTTRDKHPVKKIVLEEDGADPVFMVVEQKPKFPGGEDAFFKFLSDNIVYPKAATKNGITGTVFGSFIISKDGSVKDIKVIRGIGSGCDEETIRVLSAMPNWLPATQRGKKVNFQYTVPVRFLLDNPKQKKKEK